MRTTAIANSFSYTISHLLKSRRALASPAQDILLHSMDEAIEIIRAEHSWIKLKMHTRSHPNQFSQSRLILRFNRLFHLCFCQLKNRPL
jgi:hypothetical protein